MALFLSRYLTSPPFTPIITADDVVAAAITGYYGLQDYATVFWYHHVRFLLDPAFAGETRLGDNLATALATFLDRFQVSSRDEDETFLCSGIATTPNWARKVVERAHQGATNTGGLEKHTDFVRTVMQRMNLDNLDSKARANYASLQGVPRFRCKKLRCHHFYSGFRCAKTRDGHTAEHERPYKCPEASCYGRALGFSSKVALDSHLKDQHPPASENALFPGKRSKARSSDIWAACKEGNFDAVQHHIAEGADVHKAFGSFQGGLTPIVLAARYGHLDICRLLVQKGANILTAAYVGKPDLTAVGEAIRRRDLDFFLALLSLDEEGIRQRFLGRTLWSHIRAAVLVGFKEVLAFLLPLYDKFEDKRDFSSQLAEICSCRCKNHDVEECLELMMNHEFPKTRPGYIEGEWYPSIVKLTDGLSPLHRAFRWNNLPAVGFLLARLHQKELSTKDKQGNTLLHCMVQRPDQGRSLLLEPLLTRDGGTSFSMTNNEGETPLTSISTPLNMDVVDLLVKYGANFFSDPDRNGEIPCNIWLRNQEPPAIQLMLEYGKVDLRKPARDGRVPFSVATHRYSTDFMELLLTHDAGLAVIPDGPPSGKTSLIHALEFGNFKFVGNFKNVEFLLKLPEAETLIDLSVRCLSTHAQEKRDQLLRSCLEVGRVDLAEKILRDYRIPFTGPRDQPLDCKDWPLVTGDVRLLMFLRQLIDDLELDLEILDRLDKEASRLYKSDESATGWKQAMLKAGLTSTDVEELPFGALAGFATYHGHTRIIRHLRDLEITLAIEQPDPSRNNFMDSGNLVSLVCTLRPCQRLANLLQDFAMDFANPLTSGDVLNDFDFDSFLHDSNAGEDGTFDFSAGFMEGGMIGEE